MSEQYRCMHCGHQWDEENDDQELGLRVFDIKDTCLGEWCKKRECLRCSGHYPCNRCELTQKLGRLEW